MALIRFPLLLLFCFLFGNTFSQTFTWNSIPTTTNSSTSTFINGNMTAVITGTTGGGMTAYSYGSNSAVGNIGVCASSPAGLFLEMSGGSVAWTSQINVAITFATPICGSVTFSIYDINEAVWSADNSSYYNDQVQISATNNLAAAINPTNIAYAGCPAAANTSIVGNNRIITGKITNNTCNCNTATITVNGAGQPIKTINLLYRNGPPNISKYGALQFQNIVVSSLVATSTTPTVGITSPALACGSTTAILTATTAASSPTYSWTGSGGSTITSPTSSATAVSGIGVYTVVVNPGGCSASATYTLSSTGVAPSVTATSSNTINCNVPSINVTASTTMTPVSYTWTGPGTITSPTNSTTAVNAGGTYNYTVTNTSTGCKTSGTLVVTANTTSPTSTVTVNSAITCTSTTAVLTGTSTTSGVTYSWNPGGTTPTNNTTSVSSGGNYNLTVTDPANGCKTTTVVNVATNNTVPSPTASATGSVSCLAGSTSTLSGGAATAISYTWTGPGTITGVNTPTATAGTAGSYTLTVTAANGCSNTAVTSIGTNTIPPSPTASAGGVITCATTTVALNGGPSALTYTWSGPGFSGGVNGQNAVASTTGNYTLTVRGANGCTSSTVTTVTSNTNPPSPTASTTGSVTCSTATVALIGGPSALTYTWSGPGFSGGVNGQNAVATQAGNYTLAVTAANGCTNTAVTTVTTNTAPPVLSTIGPDLNINCTVQTATLSGSSLTSGVTYAWTGPTSGTPAGTTPTQTTTAVSAGGTYTLTMTNPVNGCTLTAFQAVTQNIVLPVVNTSTSNIITCLTTTATAIASTTTAPVSYTWTGAGITSATNGSVVTTNQGGTYNYTVTNTSNNCVATGAVNITSDITPPTATANNATLTCVNTTATLNGGPLAGVSYSWTGTGITGATNQADATVNTTGNYTLTTTAANGCTNTAIATVTNNLTTSVADAGTTQTITCLSNSVTLNGSSTPAGTPSWLGGVCGGSASFTTTACAPGTYTLEVTNPGSGCVTTATVEVTASTDVPQATVDNINTITCTNTLSTIGVTVSNPADLTYTWTGPGISGTNNTASTTATLSGTYTITLINTVTNCQSVYTAYVPEDTAPVSASVTPASSITCLSTSVALSAIPTGTNYGYSWAGGVISGSNTANPSVNAGGDYAVTITNTNNGCTGTYTVTVPTNTAIPTLTLNPSSVMTTCASPTVILNGSSSADPAATYTWTAPVTGTINDLNSNSPIAGGSGVFTVAVTNTVSGCISAVQTVTVTADANTPTLTALASNTVICEGTSATLTVSGTDTYTWSPNTSSSNSATITVTPTITTTYSVQGTNIASGCSNVTNITINVTPTPSINLSSNVNAVCEGNSAVITLTGAATYTLTNPTQVITTNTITVTPTTPTTYTVIGETANCTSATQTITVGVNALPTLAAPNQTNCAGSPVTLNASGADTYTWSTTSTTNTTVVSPTSTTDYTVSGTNTLTGCTSTLTIVSVTTTPLPTANASANPNTTCTSGTVNLNATTSVTNPTYTWTTGNGVTASNQNQPNISFPASGLTTGSYVYSLTVTSPEGCVSAQATTTLNIIDVPNANFDLSDLSICQNQSGSLSINNPQSGVTYDWIIGGTNVTNSNPASVPNTITANTGTYTVSVIASIGSCTNSANNTLTITSLPNVSLVNQSTSVCENAAAQLDVAGPNSTYNYSWVYGSQVISTNTNLSVDPVTQSNSGTYTVNVTDANGCSNRTTGLIDMQICDITVPEIFTPNGDGKNDEFFIRNIENYPDNHLKIFNRWGNLVYQKDGYLNEFIGYSNTGDAAGKEKLPSGTYYVILDLGDKKTETYTGYLLLQY